MLYSHLNLNLNTSEVREISLQSGVDGWGTLERETPIEDLRSDGITATDVVRHWVSSSLCLSSTSSLMLSVLHVFSIPALSVSLQARMLSPSLSWYGWITHSVCWMKRSTTSHLDRGPIISPLLRGTFGLVFMPAHLALALPSTLSHYRHMTSEVSLFTFLCKSFLSCRYPEAQKPLTL